MSAQPSPTGRSVAEAVARGLAARGVERVYGLPGEDHMLILSALASEGIAYVGARCENAACIMACAESQASGRTGVALVTMAPGITNAINGIANAFLDQVPLIVLCGQHPAERQSTAIRQYLDNAKVTAGVTKATFAATSSINHDLARAFAIAESVAPGPVLLEVRDEIARSDASDDLERWLGATTEAMGEPSVPVDLAVRLGAAERPVLIIGSHGRYPDIAASVSTLATRLRAPVFVTQSAIGRVRTDPGLPARSSTGTASSSSSARRTRSWVLISGPTRFTTASGRTRRSARYAVPASKTRTSPSTNGLSVPWGRSSPRLMPS